MNKSTIGAMENGEYTLRGQKLTDLIKSSDFISVSWFAWTGRMPSDGERRMIEACFVASVDHGEEPPSAQASKIVASCGKPLADAVAAGVLTFGPRHGNAAGAAAAWVHEAVSKGTSARDVVLKALESKSRLPGIGHPVYETDPRTIVLSEFAKEHIPNASHLAFMQDVARILSEEKGKRMPVNVDGAIGAIIADMGAEPELADMIFLCARTVGLAAHAREESAGSSSYRRAR